MVKRADPPPPIQPREFRSPEEIDAAIAKLQRRIQEVEKLDVNDAYVNKTGADNVIRSNVREAIRDVFGTNSPEFKEHEYIRIWSGSEHMAMSDGEIVRGIERGRGKVIGILRGLIGRLEEKRADLTAGVSPAPSSYSSSR